MPDPLPQELIDRITRVLSGVGHRVEYLYISEQAELVEPESRAGGNGSSEPQQPYPTGVRRFSLYLRYTVLEEEKAYQDKMKEGNSGATN